MTNARSTFLKALLAGAVLFFAHGAGAQTPSPQETVQQMLEAQGLGAMQVPGMAPIETQSGTWVYPVRANTLVESVLADREFGAADGIDADFMANASVHLTKIVRGPDLCRSNEMGVSEMRIIAMRLFSSDAPYMTGTQESRLVVNQELERAILYARGDVREWVPGPTFCDDQQMVLGSSGRGAMRMEYETKAHFAPLSFTAYPKPWKSDLTAVQNNCDIFQKHVATMYAQLHKRWSVIPIAASPEPLSWGVMGPSVREGMNNGKEASFADGTFNMRDAVDAAADTSAIADLSGAIAPLFRKAPKLAAGLGGVASWALEQVVGEVAGQSLDDTANQMIDMMAVANQAFHGGDPKAKAVAEYARQPVNDGQSQLHGINIDYMAASLLSACDALTQLEQPDGYAAGYITWPGGSVVLTGRGAVPGVPAAFANAPVGGVSVADALAMAQAMSGEAKVPGIEELQAQMPDGISLDALPISMTGQAVSGAAIAAGAHEWTLNYNVELVDRGEKIAELWFDPRR